MARNPNNLTTVLIVTGLGVFGFWLYRRYQAGESLDPDQVAGSLGRTISHVISPTPGQRALALGASSGLAQGLVNPDALRLPAGIVATYQATVPAALAVREPEPTFAAAEQRFPGQPQTFEEALYEAAVTGSAQASTSWGSTWDMQATNEAWAVFRAALGWEEP